jgi:hypothetical protein
VTLIAITEAPYSVVKEPERQAGHLSQFSVEVKNTWSYTPTSLSLSLFMTYCLIKVRGKLSPSRDIEKAVKSKNFMIFLHICYDTLHDLVRNDMFLLLSS